MHKEYKAEKYIRNFFSIRETSYNLRENGVNLCVPKFNLNYICIYIMIKSSKISIHRFIATTLFRVVKEWPHSSGNIHE